MTIEAASARTGEWHPIASAPKDGTTILALATGLDNRPMHAIVSWGDPANAFRSDICKPDPARCKWLGVMAVQYGVPFTHWMPLPAPPEPSNV